MKIANIFYFLTEKFGSHNPGKFNIGFNNQNNLLIFGEATEFKTQQNLWTLFEVLFLFRILPLFDFQNGQVSKNFLKFGGPNFQKTKKN